MQKFMYCFIVKRKILLVKGLPPVEIKPATLQLWDVSYVSHAFPTDKIFNFTRGDAPTIYGIRMVLLKSMELDDLQIVKISVLQALSKHILNSTLSGNQGHCFQINHMALVT